MLSVPLILSLSALWFFEPFHERWMEAGVAGKRTLKAPDPLAEPDPLQAAAPTKIIASIPER